MQNSKHFKNFILIAIILASLSGSYFVVRLSEKPSLIITKQHSSINLSSHFWNYFNLGQKRFLSSLLWIATILESDHEHYKGKDLNSWMFLRFKTISELEPSFYENYAFSGPYLSVIKDDMEGASFMYKKGLTKYPNDYYLLNQASFHFYYETKDLNYSYEILQRLNKFDKASSLVKSSLSRIEANKGNLQVAYDILTNFQNTFGGKDFLSQKIYSFRYSLRAEMDLKCLNNKTENCNRTDLDGTPYLLINGTYQAPKEWSPYRPKWISNGQKE